MTTSPLSDAFGHHVWATLRLIDACAGLTPAQLDTTVPGTYGSILDTMRHLVGADASYLYVTSGGATTPIDEERMDLGELRAAIEYNASVWPSVVQAAPCSFEVFMPSRVWRRSFVVFPSGCAAAKALAASASA